MKKNLFFYLFAVICAAGLFTACSNDDDEVKVVTCPVAETTYTDASGLKLTYNGAPMLGKRIQFRPDSQNGEKGSLFMAGDVFNWSEVMGQLMGGRSNLPVAPSTPGVFPGMSSFALPIDLKIDGEICTFEKEATNVGPCTASFKGKITKDALEVEISNVKLNDASLAGSYSLVPFDQQNSPVHLIWTTKGGNGNMEDDTLQNLLMMVLTMPVINGQTPVDMLGVVLKEVKLGEDGNIIATYMDAANGGTTYITSPANTAQYVLDKGKLMLYLNPQAIMANTAKMAQSARGTGMTEALSALIQMLPTLAANGIPVAYTQNGDRLEAYLDATILMPLLKGVVVPLLADDDFVNMIIAKMAADPQYGSMAGMVKPVLQQLPALISTTTKIELGLNLMKNK